MNIHFKWLTLLLMLAPVPALFAVVEDLSECEVYSRSGNVGEVIEYPFEIKNLGTTECIYTLYIEKARELACTYVISDSLIKIAAGEVFKGTASVTVSDRIAIGGFEKASLICKGNGNTDAKKWEYVTVRSKSHPFLLATNEFLEEAKRKIKNQEWAKKNVEGLLKLADQFEIPERKLVTKPRPTKVWTSLAYDSHDSESVFKVALAWKLTAETSYRDKVKQFVLDVSDPEKGYLSIGAVTKGVQVHEGFFFLYFAATCDLMYDENIFSESEKKNIESTFRYYLQQNKSHMTSIGIMNHQASANAGAILAALFLEDIPAIEYLLEADGGMADQIGKGVMADGWWFEGTPGYCYLVTRSYSLVAQAFENYGWDLYDRRFPVKYKSKDFDNANEGFTGMKFDIWGPTGKSTRGLREMVSAYIPMMDENAHLVASNDGTLAAPHPFYELAYRQYRDEKLAWVINHSERDSWISLIYGMDSLPEIADPRSKSAYVSNVGLVALRSQTKDIPADEQIQTYLKFGTHGGWHGQFDRTGLVALDRYGHKYFGTEMVWFGYGHAGYKECVQTSATHNMVIVDGLQQEAVPSEQLKFFAGEMMQTSVLQTVARWRKIPTFNSENFPPWDDTDFAPDFEPVLQRRLSIVTDDYLVIADYVKASQNHQYDWLLHPIGFENIDGASKKGKLMGQLNSANDSPYKYFTNAQWYQMKKGSQVSFKEGEMKLDVHTLWPRKAEVVIAHYPNGGKRRGLRNNPERRTYGVRIDGMETFFLHVVEPYKGQSMIKEITSTSAGEIIVLLEDGREQTILINNFKGSGNDIEVSITETKNGKLVRKETSKE